MEISVSSHEAYAAIRRESGDEVDTGNRVFQLGNKEAYEKHGYKAAENFDRSVHTGT